MKKPLTILILLLTYFSCSEIEPNILNLINSERNKPLQWNNDLELIATIQSEYMSETGDYNHVWLDGTTLIDRFKMIDYKVTYIAENIAMGYGSDELVFKAWMSSECHRANILNEYFNYVGVSNVGGYWTMILSK